MVDGEDKAKGSTILY